MKIILSCLFMLSSLVHATPEVGQVEVSPTVGGPGVTVDIKGPANLVERLKNCMQPQFRGGNNGISLDWGDGSKMPNNANNIKSCREFLLHDYAKIGQYTVKVLLTKAGPTDGIETEWIGQATVTVKAGGK